MPSETGSAGFTFVVDPVTQAEKPIWSETLAESLDRRFKRKVLVLPGEQKPVINAAIDSPNASKWIKPFDEKTRAMMTRSASRRIHPFMDAVHIAFSQHRPLTLSPDGM